jgi:hypothetical protein
MAVDLAPDRDRALGGLLGNDRRSRHAVVFAGSRGNTPA